MTSGRLRDETRRPVPNRQLEVETKLEIAGDEDLPDLSGHRRLRGSGIRTVSAPEVYELDAVYYDTARLDLLSSRLTLRRRTGGHDAGWHLKLPAGGGARTEVTLPLEDGAAAADPAGGPAVDRPDGDGGVPQRVPAALAELVAGAARGRPLVPVCRIRNRRVVRRLADAAGTDLVELADDHVAASRLTATGTADTGTEPLRWRELEVELLAGTAEQLAATVAALRAAGARPASSASKLARALGREPAAPDGDRTATGSASGTGSGTGKADRTAGAAVLAALARLRDAQIVADRALREGAGEALHDARAGARRLRSVLGAYAPLFDTPAVPLLRAELRDLGRVLSGARDLEVLRDRLTAQLVDEPAEFAAAAQDRLAAHYRRTEPALLAAVGEYIRSERYFELLRGIDQLLAEPALARRSGRPATAELPELVAARWRSLRSSAVRALAQTQAEEGGDAVHETRKRAKALRYAVEAAVPALGSPAVVFAAAVEQLQEVLGEHQDALTSAALLVELARRPDTDGTAGFTFGRLHAFEQAVAHGAVDDFGDAWARIEDGELLAALRR
ncbi:CYTH and CHAD domain-containing protein [Nakamurella endophytica]|uniref:CHAD domain-containing protein n=1 Tax=Nakamurella endophytica TaxID=1748367 RepID=A0A917WJJ5_9ACTN|nr:CYTH and CHAD domain-containing protein [Nakamurella endophytica]GGM08227.1 CHAD domain-containing protein [Nakamurella endophytica]